MVHSSFSLLVVLWLIFFMCRYLFSLSGALVLLNVVPCYALDGQWILKSLLDILLPSFICSRQIRRLIFSILLSLGTALLSVNIGLALWYLFLETSSSLSHLPPIPLVRSATVWDDDAEFNLPFLPSDVCFPLAWLALTLGFCNRFKIGLPSYCQSEPSSVSCHPFAQNCGQADDSLQHLLNPTSTA